MKEELSAFLISFTITSSWKRQLDLTCFIGSQLFLKTFFGCLAPVAYLAQNRNRSFTHELGKCQLLPFQSGRFYCTLLRRLAVVRIKLFKSHWHHRRGKICPVTKRSDFHDSQKQICHSVLQTWPRSPTGLLFPDSEIIALRRQQVSACLQCPSESLSGSSVGWAGKSWPRAAVGSRDEWCSHWSMSEERVHYSCQEGHTPPPAQQRHQLQRTVG